MKNDKPKGLTLENVFELGLENARKLRQIGLHDEAIKQLKSVEELIQSKATPKIPPKGIC